MKRVLFISMLIIFLFTACGLKDGINTDIDLCKEDPLISIAEVTSEPEAIYREQSFGASYLESVVIRIKIESSACKEYENTEVILSERDEELLGLKVGDKIKISCVNTFDVNNEFDYCRLLRITNE